MYYQKLPFLCSLPYIAAPAGYADGGTATAVAITESASTGEKYCGGGGRRGRKVAESSLRYSGISRPQYTEV